VWIFEELQNRYLEITLNEPMADFNLAILNVWKSWNVALMRTVPAFLGLEKILAEVQESLKRPEEVNRMIMEIAQATNI
jgi:hypothetical protein